VKTKEPAFLAGFSVAFAFGFPSSNRWLLAANRWPLAAVASVVSLVNIVKLNRISRMVS